MILIAGLIVLSVLSCLSLCMAAKSGDNIRERAWKNYLKEKE